MLASINPLGERSRNQRYPMTVVAYIAGSTVAGAILGGALGFVGAPFAGREVAPIATPAGALAQNSAHANATHVADAVTMVTSASPSCAPNPAP